MKEKLNIDLSKGLSNNESNSVRRKRHNHSRISKKKQSLQPKWVLLTIIIIVQHVLIQSRERVAWRRTSVLTWRFGCCPRRRRGLFPFRKQAMPFSTVDAIIGNQAFSIADVIVCSGLCCNKVISNFFKSS